MAKKTDHFTPPAHLSSEMKAWTRHVVEHFSTEEHHFRILILAAESWDDCVRARKVLQARGTSYTDRFGAPRMRPECAILRDSRLAFLRCLAALGIQAESAGDEAAEPKIKSRREKHYEQT